MNAVVEISQRGVVPERHNFDLEHSGIAMLTPYPVHYDLANGVLAKRQHALKQVFAKHRQSGQALNFEPARPVPIDRIF